jgi:hypothetical protein
VLLAIVGCEGSDEAASLKQEQENLREELSGIRQAIEREKEVLADLTELRTLRQEIEREREVLAELKEQETERVPYVRPDTLPVTGYVKLDGNPVGGLDVVFYPAEGLGAVGTTDANGKFTLSTFELGDGALPGWHGVAIWVSGQSDLQTPVHGKIIPLKYSDYKTSNLNCEVREGMEPPVFNLESR